MRSSRLVVTAALALAGTFALSGVATAGDALSTKEWRSEVNSLCVDVDQESAGISDEVFGANPADPTLDQMTEYVSRIKPLFTGLLADIADLQEPSALKKKVKKLIAAGRADFKALVADPSLGLEGNPIETFTTKAGKLGLSSCA